MFRKEYEAFFIPLVSALHTLTRSPTTEYFQEEHIMKRIVSIIIAIALMLTATAALAIDSLIESDGILSLSSLITLSEFWGFIFFPPYPILQFL